jgi:NADPH:quinone reductase-like Zn-dependent oxidoreductase
VRAVLQDRYGPPDVLRIADVPTPEPGPGKLLVRVRAVSVNARDWHLLRGEPRLARLDRSTFGRRGPREPIRGTDFAGIVESVGAGVTGWRPGQEVFGESEGALAEYVAAPIGVVAAKPPGLTFEQAVALPLAANTALALLRAGHLVAGDSVLINGASGGVGTFAVQLATSMGARVTAVCSARNAELARSLGAQATVDYASEDFAADGRRYDVVVDLVGNRSLRDLRRVVARDGWLVLSGGGVSGDGRFVGPMAMFVKGVLMARLASARIATPQPKPSTEALTELAGLVGSGALTPVIDRTFAFDDAAAAIRYLEVEHARAKVVVTI